MVSRNRWNYLVGGRNGFRFRANSRLCRDGPDAFSGQTFTGVVTLNHAAYLGGVTICLASSTRALAPVPAMVSIPYPGGDRISVHLHSTVEGGGAPVF